MPDSLQGVRNIFNRIDQAKSEVSFIAEALVTNVRKKDKRVELVLLPDLEEIGWIRLYMLNANGNYSSGQLPEKDTTVLVLFPNGERRNAICLAGGFCEAGELGYELKGDYDVVFTDKYGNKILMEETGITLEDKSGNKIVTTSSKIMIEASSAMDIKSTGAMKIDSSAGIDITSTGSATFKGSTMTIEGTATLDIKAPLIKLNNGTLPIARVGDMVATPMGPGTILPPGNPQVLA
jgi:phage baseplate assembly protein gpV